MRKYYFTLLELIVCIVLVAIVASAISWQITGIIETSRFKSSTKIVKREIEKLQMLALIFASDMQVEIRKEKSNYSLSFKTDEAVLKNLNNTSTVLKGVTKITWNEEPNVKLFYFTILSNGIIVQKGVLGLHRENEAYFLDTREPLQIKVQQSYTRIHQTPHIPQKPKSLSHETSNPKLRLKYVIDKIFL